MALLRSKLNSRKALNAFQVLCSPFARQCHWFPDYKPNQYPLTKEERLAAAKKYNMLPEEYEPYPNEDGCGFGDYPNLPFESVDAKDPYYNWDYPYLRRNYLDPVPCEATILLPEAISTKKRDCSIASGLFTLLSWISGLGVFFYIIGQFRIDQPILKKQYKIPRVIHYTFDLEEDQKK